jgi:general secretion pathway protein K
MAAADQRGFALASVLWAVTILSLMAAGMLATRVSSARIDAYGWDETRARTIADAGVQQAILRLFDPGGSRIADGAARDFTDDGAVASVSVVDERGKIDINYTGRELLAGLLSSGGAPQEQARDLAERIAERRKRAPFRFVGDLKSVDGVTPELFERILPAITVFTHTANLDMNTASREALMALPGFDAASADALIAERAKRRSGDSAVANSLAPRPVYGGRVYSIRSEVALGRARFARRAVVALTDDPERPFWILDWAAAPR